MRKFKSSIVITFLTLFIAAFLIRFINLDIFPINDDEYQVVLDCREAYDKFLGIPVACSQGEHHPFLSYLSFLSDKIFDSPEYIIRIPMVVIGMLSIVMIFLLTKEMYGSKTAIIARRILPKTVQFES